MVVAYYLLLCSYSMKVLLNFCEQKIFRQGYHILPFRVEAMSEMELSVVFFLITKTQQRNFILEK